MTAGLPEPPFAANPEDVAPAIVRAIDRGTPQIYVPAIWRLVMLVIRWLPERGDAPGEVLGPPAARADGGLRVQRSGSNRARRVGAVAIAVTERVTVLGGARRPAGRPAGRPSSATAPATASPPLTPGRRAADVPPAAGLPPRARRQRAARRRSGVDGHGCRRPAVGRRDARLHAELRGHRRGRAGRAGRRARGHRRRRPRRTAHRVPRRPGPAAHGEGARARRARHRAAAADPGPRHQRRPEGRHAARCCAATSGSRAAIPSTAPTACCGALDNWLYTSEYATDFRWTRDGLEQRADAARAASGASRWTTPGASSATGTTIRCTSTTCPAALPRAQPVGGAHARRLRAGDRGPRGVGGAADAGGQSRLSRRRAAAGRHRSPSSRRPARRPSIAAIGCPPRSAATSSSPSPPATWCGAMSIEGRRRRPARRDERASARRVPDLDRRALPSGEPAVGGRRHALRRRHVPRRDPARAVPVGVPEEPDPRPRPGRADRARAASIASCTRRTRRARAAGARRRRRPAELVPVLGASERLVARHRAAAARRARRSRRSRPRWARWSPTRDGRADAAARAVDARRARRARRRDGRSARCATRRPRSGPPPCASPSPWLAQGRRSACRRPVWALADDRAPRVRWQLARVDRARCPRPSRVEQRGAAAGAARARPVRRRRRGQQPDRPRGIRPWRSCWRGRARPTTRSACSPAPSPAAADRTRWPISGRGSPTRAGRWRSAWRWRAGVELALSTESFGVRTPRRLTLAARAAAAARRARTSGGEIERRRRPRSSTAWTGRASRARPRRSCR